MKQIKLFLIIALTNLSMIGFSQFSDIQSAIEQLDEGETFILEYAKSGDWGAYESGKMTFTLTTNDTIYIQLTNKQAYLGSESTTTSTAYDRLLLLETLEENKRAYLEDPNNIVFNNAFHYRINKDGHELSTGASPLTPTDVVNKLSLDHRIKNIFFKESNSPFNHGINGKLKKQ